jgi:hypothetical protein
MRVESRNPLGDEAGLVPWLYCRLVFPTIGVRTIYTVPPHLMKATLSTTENDCRVHEFRGNIFMAPL